MARFDIRDRRLLYELDKNSRQSYGQLARKIGLSKNTISYRIDKLIEEGIIKRFHTVVNVSNLGYSVFRIYLNFCNTTPEKEKEIIDFFKSKDIVTWMVSMEGEYNLCLLAVTKDVGKIYKTWEEFSENYLNYFDNRLLTLITSSHYFPKAYLAEALRNNEEIIMINEPKDTHVSNKDMEILRILSLDSRAQIVDIAHKLRISTGTVMNRIKYLEKNKVIMGYKTVFDLNKLGYHSYKIGFSLLKTSKESLSKILHFCKENPNVVYQEMAIGGKDIEIEIQVRDNGELRKILDEIRRRFSSIIRDYKILDVYEKHKSVFLPTG